MCSFVHRDSTNWNHDMLSAEYADSEIPKYKLEELAECVQNIAKLSYRKNNEE